MDSFWCGVTRPNSLASPLASADHGEDTDFAEGPEREAPMSHRRPGSARVLLLLASAAAAVALLAGAATPVAAAARTGPPAKYYLSLGDSLAQGVQPAPPAGQSFPTDQGYVDDLFAHYSTQFPGNLHLVKLGCPGETTTSMLTGAESPCTYPAGSQLAAALAFIRAHRSAAVLITIDIGANNVDGCAAGGVINQTCVADGFAAARSDLPKILGALRNAVGEDTVITGMNLYDPFLADFLTGSAGQAVAAQSVNLDVAFNSLLGASFGAVGIPVADVQTAFSTTDFTDTATLPGIGTVPLNVARICEWTWMCAPAPIGPNIHANPDGYQVIAVAFQQVIGRLG
jgi:lysophospholipase L1-like esterase